MKTYLVYLSILGLSISLNAQIPDIEVQNVSGDTVQLKEQIAPGQRALIILWAYWSSPCLRQLNDWKNFASEWENRYGINIIGLSIDPINHRDEAIEKWENNDYYGTLFFAEDGLKSFGADFIPSFYFYGTDGKLIYQNVGYEDANELNKFIVTTSLPSFKEKFTVDISPNPVRGHLNIYLSTTPSLPSEIIIRMFDLTGQEILGVFPIQQKYTQTISLKSLSPSVYIIVVIDQTGQRISRHRIIKI